MFLMFCRYTLPTWSITLVLRNSSFSLFDTLFNVSNLLNFGLNYLAFGCISLLFIDQILFLPDYILLHASDIKSFKYETYPRMHHEHFNRRSAVRTHLEH
jgi:hypothetical protein